MQQVEVNQAELLAYAACADMAVWQMYSISVVTDASESEMMCAGTGKCKRKGYIQEVSLTDIIPEHSKPGFNEEQHLQPVLMQILEAATFAAGSSSIVLEHT